MQPVMWCSGTYGVLEVKPSSYFLVVLYYGDSVQGKIKEFFILKVPRVPHSSGSQSVLHRPNTIPDRLPWGSVDTFLYTLKFTYFLIKGIILTYSMEQSLS